MKPSTRIILNTLATYGRSIFAISLTLFSGRWVYNSLGQTDFGLYSVVGSIIVFIVFLNNIMSNSAGRFFAFSHGSGNSSEVNHWFNAALSLHLILAIVLILFGLPIGEWVIRNFLNIPSSRVDACVWVFRLSLFSAFVSMIAVPFNAMFTAKQNIVEIAGWGMLQTVLCFVLAYSIRFSPVDKLVFYAIGMVAIVSAIRIIIMARASKKYLECSIQRDQWFSKERISKIFNFAVWSLFGAGGAMLRDEGTAVLLNVYFGPNVNAAFGISNQVSSQTNQLSSAMIGSFSPEITASEGRGDRERMLRLSNSASKFGTLLILFFGIPLVVEMELVLKLWLHQPPEYSKTFCQLIIIAFMIERLSTGTLLAVSAKGRIAAYQATVGTIILLTLPLSWLMVSHGFPPTSIGYSMVFTMALASVARSLWASHLFDASVLGWLKTIVIPCLMTAGLSGLAAMVIQMNLPAGLFRLALVSLGSVICTLIAAWFLIFDQSEKEYSLRIYQKSLKRFFRTNA